MMNNCQISNMYMNNQNNQNNNVFPDQRNVAQIYNRQNSINYIMINNNNMNIMNNKGMKNQIGIMNNNSMNIMNNNSMNMMNNNNMNMMNNNNINMMNNNNMNMMNNNTNMMNNNNNMNIMNNMPLVKNNMGNMVMTNNNNSYNNMGIVRYNPYNFHINWFNNNFFPNTVNQNNFYVMKMLQNQVLQRQYYQMIFQQKMFYQMMNRILMEKKRIQRMNEILEQSGQKSEDDNSFIPLNNNINNNNNDVDDNYAPNQALLDVIQESHPPPQPQNQNNPILPSELVSEVIADVMNLNPDLLSGLGNNLLGEWAQGENRGGRPYKPPNGWIGYGLNVLNKYDNENNDWLACNGRQGEWCIAYHGACGGQSSDNVKKGIKSILETNLKAGSRQAYQNSDDANHPGQKVGRGVYCSPEPSVIEGYAGTMNINGHNYRAAFMLRVKPDRIRYSSSQPNYWVLNGDFSELRPYRLLIKPC